MTIEQLISINEKRSFLKWFLGRYDLKAKECMWLLNYILSDDHIIGLLRFVDSIEKCPRAMLIADRHSSSPAFLYRKERVETNEPEKAFHDIRLFQDDPIYIQLDFEGASHAAPYLSVLEDPPFAEMNIEERYGHEASRILLNSEKRFTLDKLTKAIDEALAKRDKQVFQTLTNQLKALQKEIDEDGSDESNPM
ncbi:ReoY family proteolytic degradation factor [Pullulanibacillus sp. KACC 23026]|uniref:ReoY family proteolytic degradation factor n=1 Tax=Pullulanibacillus sp. KACC 23026 TaxID=3028315 RepID=UPI0023B098EF|nr:ReoY family proteolytic degradation factor [Pullulanibacillus sp. KACC 23026]WEG11360.1 ReoY family proteolytic degradation factor [Pullulanibacillus sp. KACC 23026]